jgi:uncharacterized protein YwgA
MSKKGFASGNIKRFSIEDISLKNYNMMDWKLIVSDLVLALLSISPVQVDKMQRTVFLTWKEVFADVSLDPVFFPSGSGPYSEVIQESLKILDTDKQIRLEGDNKSSLSYSITQKGKDKIIIKLNYLKISDLRSLPDKKSMWDKWSTQKALRYIGYKYPNYIIKSSGVSLDIILGLGATIGILSTFLSIILREYINKRGK